MQLSFISLFLRLSSLFLIGIFVIVAGTTYAAEPQETPDVSVKVTARPAVPDKDDYVIGPGDVLDIAVWKDEALTKSVVVRPDGKISFPLIGEIEAGGKTVVELKKAMKTQLNRYVPNVELFVNVQQINSMIVYVIGKVNNPGLGRLVLNSPVNVLQVLATAGGLNVYAKRSSIKIFRQRGSETRIFNFNYDEVSEGRNLEKNVLLQRGDVVVVP